MTLQVLMTMGYIDEATQFMDWVGRRCTAAGSASPLQVLYGLDGRRELHEEALAHLEGYRGSKPVRIGNGAWNQLQLDIYGELLDAADLYDQVVHPIAHDFWSSLAAMTDWVCENWRRPDHGIWEVRGALGESLHSRAMCWVAIDRALHLARRRSLPAPLAAWIETRDEIWRDLYERFWNPRLPAFTHFPGTDLIDASCLLLPLVGFIGGRDPRWLDTLKVVGDRLVEDSLVYRYRTDGDYADGVGGKEGTFSMCSFWYVECLARSGDVDQARFVFEKLLGYANHLGLYSEELGPRREHLGNFPQAFTHLSLIRAAVDLDQRLSRAGHGA
jgi:GH15 family glucan-1,4-alpha-glucosidase